jgi:hypothetical protein
VGRCWPSSCVEPPHRHRCIYDLPVHAPGLSKRLRVGGTAPKPAFSFASANFGVKGSQVIGSLPAKDGSFCVRYGSFLTLYLVWQGGDDGGQGPSATPPDSGKAKAVFGQTAFGSAASTFGGSGGSSAAFGSSSAGSVFGKASATAAAAGTLSQVGPGAAPTTVAEQREVFVAFYNKHRSQELDAQVDKAVQMSASKSFAAVCAALKKKYHLRNIILMVRTLDWLRFTYVFENRSA